MRYLRNVLLVLLVLFSTGAFAQDMKGKIAPEWRVKNKDGKVVSLSDFKGKYVMIDVWATWCGPCRNEIPHFARLADKYKGKNIQFVSISLDSKKRNWEVMIAKEHNAALQLIDLRAGEAPIAKDYKISGIPRFILINPEGRVEEWFAPRPSDPALDKLLTRLLK